MKKQPTLTERFGPSDVIAVVTIIGGFILMALHIDTVVGAVVTSVVAFYFGRKAAR